MTWNEVVKLFNIEMETNMVANGYMEVRVKLECFDKRGHYMFSYDVIDYNKINGVDIFEVIKHRVIQDFELERWVGEKINLEVVTEGYFDYK